jgi:RNA polymerase sigma-70 factor (ECF subfamily)
MESTDRIKNPSDLMRRAKAGDEEAFALLYKEYFTPVYRYVYFRVRSKHEAEDLTQSVFVKAYEAIDRFEERGKNPLAYFFTIARNTVINHWRKKKEVATGELETLQGRATDLQHNPHELIDDHESVQAIKRGLAALTEEQSEVITMKFLSELSNKEIAEALGKTEEAVRQLQCRGLRALRKNLDI